MRTQIDHLPLAYKGLRPTQGRTLSSSPIWQRRLPANLPACRPFKGAGSAMPTLQFDQNFLVSDNSTLLGAPINSSPEA